MNAREGLGYSWSLDDPAAAVVALARATGLPLLSAPRRAPASDGARPMSRRVSEIADSLGLEARETEVLYDETVRFLRRGAPALIEVDAEGRRGLVALASGGRRSVVLASPAGHLERVPLRDVDQLLRAGAERAHEPKLRATLAAMDIAGDSARHARARWRLLEHALGAAVISGCHCLYPRASQSLSADLSSAGVWRPAAAAVCVHLVAHAFGIISWLVLGRQALQGSFGMDDLWVWCLAMATSVGLGTVESLSLGNASLLFGAALKRKLLLGALQLDVDTVRSAGVGEFLGRVIESEALEGLLTGGGFAVAFACAELLVLPWIVLYTPLGAPFLALSALWAALGMAAVYHLYRRSLSWSKLRIGMTRDLVERLVGHRTRLAQQPLATWHDEEDTQLATYSESSRDIDIASTWLSFASGRAFFLVGFAYAAVVLLGGSFTPLAVAGALGTLLLVDGALGRLIGGAQTLLKVTISGQMVASLYRAAQRDRAPGSVGLSSPHAGADSLAVAELRQVTFTHGTRLEAALRGVSLRVEAGDRILMEGPSGGGKSTLAALLSGARAPSGGLVLCHGLDVGALGQGRWRREVITVPQFHENYVLSESLAFNLLLGSTWPPTPAALARLRELCDELGLTPLIRRMPAGLNQIVGESGWQLSHGERSRLFIARALMQEPSLLILDESLGALDPEMQGEVLSCILRRARALMVIAHP